MYIKRMVPVILATAVILTGFFIARPTLAASQGDVLINEIMTQPTSGQEWYELFNTTTSAIDLTGWTIRRTVTSDSLALSGTLPAYGLMVFSVASTAGNDTGDAVSLYDANSTVIAALTYGLVPSPSPLVPHATVPGADQSAAASINMTSLPPTITYAVGTPTKGWFNNAVDFACAQLGASGQTTAPTLSSVATCLTSQSQVVTNLGSLADPSAATDLYFEKSVNGSPMGRITFTGPLNLSDMNTVSYLQSIGQKMEAAVVNGIDVKVGLDTSITSLFSSIAATITMYNVPGTGAPDLVVKNNAGTVIAPGSADYPTITPGTFDATAHTYTFSTSHFTSFQTNASGLAATVKPVVKNIATTKGAYALKVGTKTVSLKPFGNYTGRIWSKKISLGSSVGTTYLFANLDDFGQGAIKAYNNKGKLLATYKPFVGFATKGLVLDIAVNTNNTAYVAVGAPNSLTVKIYKVTAKGLTTVNSVKAFKTTGNAVVKFSKIYGSDYGLLTYLRTKITTLKIWKYNTTTNKFAEDKTYSKTKISVK